MKSIRREKQILTDEGLIEAVKSGDDHAFKELVQRYESLVAATVIGMIGKCPEAEDVGQETFIRLYKNLHNFRGTSSIGTYITRIAINLSLNELKRRKRRALLFFSKPTSEELDIADENSTNPYDDRQELIQRAIGLLESKFRTVIVLRLIDGYSTAETAKILNLPVGTILSRLARAQQKLKAYLSPYLGNKQ